MYLHIGQDMVVRSDDIVGIFDMENTTISKFTREFLADAEKGGRVVNVCDDLPRSFVVCRDRQGEETVYVSQISCATLLKRSSGQGGRMASAPAPAVGSSPRTCGEQFAPMERWS